MNNDVLTNINDDSLRMTLTIIEMISQNPGQYSLSDIGSLLHIDVYDVRRILANILCDMGGIFVLTNGDAIADSTQIMDANSKYGNATTKLSLISKYELTDLNGKNQFEELRRKFLEKKSETYTDVIIKHAYTSSTNHTKNENLQKIRNAIKKSKTLEVSLANESSVCPLFIFHDQINDIDYLVNIDSTGTDYTVNFHPADEITSIGEKSTFSAAYKCNDSIIDELIDELRAKLRYLWSPVNFMLSEPVITVKALVFNEANCIHKIRQDISNNPHANFQEIDKEKYLLTVKTVGQEGFIKWIMCYGSSVVVLEPEGMRSQILDKYEKIVQQYS